MTVAGACERGQRTEPESKPVLVSTSGSVNGNREGARRQFASSGHALLYSNSGFNRPVRLNVGPFLVGHYVDGLTCHFDLDLVSNDKIAGGRVVRHADVSKIINLHDEAEACSGRLKFDKFRGAVRVLIAGERRDGK